MWRSLARGRLDMQATVCYGEGLTSARQNRCFTQPAHSRIQSAGCFFELGVGRILESDILGIAAMD